jgi:hypothetical protein
MLFCVDIKGIHGNKLTSTPNQEGKLRAFENIIQRRTFGPMRENVTRGRKQLHYVELQNLSSSPRVISELNSMGTGWLEHLTQIAWRT